MRKRGFTLIELLVVIAIIAILAAILFPVFAQAREKARASGCLSNVKQIATALYMYTQDYDESTPGGCFSLWGCSGPGETVTTGMIDETGAESTTCCRYSALWPLMPYTKNEGIFVCPSVVGWDIENYRPRKGSYATNQIMQGGTTHPMGWHGWGASLSLFENPAESVAFADARTTAIGGSISMYLHCWIGNRRYCHWYSGSTCMDCTDWRTDWHNEGINQVYVDGHAKWSSLSRITYGQWMYMSWPKLDKTSPLYNCPITINPSQCNHPGI
jgi:prepilin-type N-terminal cleavage/methylation domain-containing protein/prepilin-type processing-associated H-X9-DG protein